MSHIVTRGYGGTTVVTRGYGGTRIYEKIWREVKRVISKLTQLVTFNSRIP